MRRSRLEKLAECLQGDVLNRSDWDEVIATANAHLLGPHLYHQILKSGRLDQVDPEAVEYLGSQAAANHERSRRLLAQLDEAASAMNDVGVIPLAIKGMAALLQSDRVEEFPRIVRDVDLLIGKAEAAPVDRALSDLGYDAERVEEGGHSVGNYVRCDAVGVLDLHIRLPRRVALVVTMDDLMSRAREARLANSVVRIPDASAHVAINLAHDMIHNRCMYSGIMDLGYLVELVQFIGERGDEIDQPWIEQKQKIRRFGLSVEMQARMARHLFGSASFIASESSALGWALHHRRRLKTRFAPIDRLDTALFERIYPAIQSIRRSRAGRGD